MAQPQESSSGWQKTAAEQARSHKHMFADEAHAIVCHLRLDAKLAQYYCPSLVDARGATMVDGKTGADEILVALFKKLGGETTRVKRPPKKTTKNEKGAAVFKLGKRNGRPNKETAVADAAARLVKDRGEARVRAAASKGPRSSSTPPPRKSPPEYKLGNFTSRGNAIAPAKACAIVEVPQFSSWVKSTCRCVTCGGALAYVSSGSVQVGAAAVWRITCKAGCEHAPLKTSAPLYGDDFEINHTINYASVTCAVPYTRANELLRTIGLGEISSRDHYACKAEFEQPFAHAAEATMAQAWQQELREGVPENEGCLIADNGWDHGRNGAVGVMPIMSATTGRMVQCELSRRNDPGVKSSQALEPLNFRKLLRHPLIVLGLYNQVALDGACALIAAARKAGLDVQGDGWHMGRNRGKHFKGHVDAFMPRELPSAKEKTARAADKPERPPQLAAAVARLGKAPLEEPPASAEQMRAALRAAGETQPESRSGGDGGGAAAAGGGDSDDAADEKASLGALYAALRSVEHAKAAFAKLGNEPPERVADLPLPAYAKQLAGAYAVRARQAKMTEEEQSAWAEFDEYCLLQGEADAARAARTARNKDLQRARRVAVTWERNLRSVYNFLFAYTKSLKGTLNPATERPWTDAERTAEAQRLYPDAALHLLAGIVDADSLLLIGHPASKQKEEERSWKPPASGFVEPGENLVWEILEGWVRDPRCLEKFSFYIDNRSTAYCECWMSKKLKWTPKTQHFTRYFNLGIWCSIMDHNENVGRDVLAVRWRRGHGQKHDGRWYQSKVRTRPTDVWRRRLGATCLAEARRRSAAQLTPPAVEAQPTWVADLRPSTVQSEVAEWLAGVISRVEAAAADDGDARAAAPAVHAPVASASWDAPASASATAAAAAAAAAVASVVGKRVFDDRLESRDGGSRGGLVVGLVAGAGADGLLEIHWDTGAVEEGYDLSRVQEMLYCPVSAEQVATIESAAAEAASAAAERDGAAAATAQLEAPQKLTPELIAGFKVPALKEHLSERGLGTSGKKGELAARLLEAVQEEEEDGIEEEEEEEEEAVQPRRAAGGAQPAAQADACGVALQWYLQDCPGCKTTLRVRLAQPLTALACAECGVHFCAFNAHLAAHPPKPPAPPRRPPKWSPMQKALREFMSKALPQRQRERPNETRAQRFRAAMADWKQHRTEHPEVGQPAEAEGLDDVLSSAAAGANARGQSPAEPIVAQLLDVSSGARGGVEATRGAKAMLLAAQPTPLPLPAFMPLEQRPKQKRERMKPGEKKLVRQPTKTPAAPLKKRRCKVSTAGGRKAAAAAASSPVQPMDLDAESGRRPGGETAAGGSSSGASGSASASAAASGSKRKRPRSAEAPELAAKRQRETAEDAANLEAAAAWAPAVRVRAMQRSADLVDLTVEQVKIVYDMLLQLWRASGSEEECSVDVVEARVLAQTCDLRLSDDALDSILKEMEEANILMYRDGALHKV